MLKYYITTHIIIIAIILSSDWRMSQALELMHIFDDLIRRTASYILWQYFLIKKQQAVCVLCVCGVVTHSMVKLSVNLLSSATMFNIT